MGDTINATAGYRTTTYRDAITRPNDTTTYTAGDVISEVTTNDHFTFGAASDDGSKRVGRPNPGTITINAARLWSSANQTAKPSFELWLFNVDIAEVADNSAFAVTDAEMLTLVGIIDFAQGFWKVGLATIGAGGNSVCEIKNIDLPVNARPGRLYGQLVDRAGYIPVASEIFTVDLICSPD